MNSGGRALHAGESEMQQVPVPHDLHVLGSVTLSSCGRRGGQCKSMDKLGMRLGSLSRPLLAFYVLVDLAEPWTN